jgi:hypothetical protein
MISGLLWFAVHDRQAVDQVHPRRHRSGGGAFRVAGPHMISDSKKIVLIRIPILLLGGALVLTGCNQRAKGNNFKLITPDTVFVDSCNDRFCEFEIRSALATIKGLDSVALRINCPACNFTVSSCGYHAEIVSPDSGYWYTKIMADMETRDKMFIERFRQYSKEDIIDPASNTLFRKVTLTEGETDFPLKIRLDLRDTGRSCRIGFISSLPRNEVVKRKSGNLNERSFQVGLSTEQSRDAVWSKNIVFFKFTPFDRLMRDMMVGEYVSSSNSRRVEIRDTEGVRIMNSILKRPNFKKEREAKSELKALRDASMMRIFEMENAYLFPRDSCAISKCGSDSVGQRK